MGIGFVRLVGSGAIVLGILTAIVRPGLAVHESTNTLVFEPVQGEGAASASGTGTVDFRGGGLEDSRWTATFRFEGLDPGAAYVVAVQGRFDAEGTPGAVEFSPICAFTTDPAGEGGCWYYFVVLINLAVVQVQAGELRGPVALQATRKDGPGSIVGEANRFSPAQPATPVATPTASPAPTRGAA